MFRYERLKEVVDPTVDVSDLAINEADKILLLLRSLPESCRQFLTLHVPIQTFKNLCDAALKYEAQQRAWTELNSKPIAPFKGEKGDKGKGKDGKGKKGKGNRMIRKGKVRVPINLPRVHPMPRHLRREPVLRVESVAIWPISAQRKAVHLPTRKVVMAREKERRVSEPLS